MLMGRKKKGGEAKAETGVGRGGIGGILMAKRGRVEGIGRGIDLIADWGIGRERGIRIEESAREAMREEEMKSGHPAAGESGVALQTHRDGGGILEIESMITEDELDLFNLVQDLSPKGRASAITHGSSHPRPTDSTYRQPSLTVPYPA